MSNVLLALVANERPLINIDITLLLNLGLWFVLFFFLKSTFWGPRPPPFVGPIINFASCWCSGTWPCAARINPALAGAARGGGERDRRGAAPPRRGAVDAPRVTLDKLAPSTRRSRAQGAVHPPGEAERDRIVAEAHEPGRAHARRRGGRPSSRS
jgi:hypothetical protein